MPRTKKLKIKFSTARTDAPINERLAGCGRGEKASILYIGELVEAVISPESHEKRLREFGSILIAYINGKKSEITKRAKSDHENAAYYLGQLTNLEEIWEDLEQYVLDKDKLYKLPTEEENVEVHSFSPE